MLAAMRLLRRNSTWRSYCGVLKNPADGPVFIDAAIGKIPVSRVSPLTDAVNRHKEQNTRLAMVRQR
jgi:hypothetical protein